MFISTEPGLKLGQHLVDGRTVSVHPLVQFQCLLRLNLRVITYKVLKAAGWRLPECPGFS